MSNLQTSSPDEYSTSTYNAVGQMVRLLGETVDATRYYDGDAREVKRQTSHYVETETSSSWVVQPTKYFIRSSVLGGATVSEVWANGKKNKTYVRAAGTQLAYQTAYYSETSTLYEVVLFQYTDASGMSQRTTDKDATPAAYGDGGEGSPVEADPLGSNAGTSSPYFEPVIYNPDPEYPQLLLFYDDSPTYVNGQRLTCTLDGFAIGCSSAFHSLENGSAIPAGLAPYQNLPGFQFNSYGLGIFSATIPYDVFTNNSGRVWAQPQGTLGEGSRIFAGGSSIWTVSWNVSLRPVISSQDESITLGPIELTREPIKLIAGAVNEYLEKNSRCRKFVNSLLSQLGKDNNIELAGDITYFLGELGRTGSILASLYIPEKGWKSTGGGEVMRPNFGSPGWGIIVEFTNDWGDATRVQNMVLILHELIHVIGRRGGVSNFSDISAAKALENLGIARNLDDFFLMEPNPSRGRGAGALWGQILMHECGTRNSRPKGMRN